jgi:hypothetical protein
MPHPPPAARVAVTWDGLGLDLPSGWHQIEVSRDHAIWADALRAHTVTIGAAVPTPGALLRATVSARAAFVRSLRGARLVGPATQLADGRTMWRALLPTQQGGLHVTQVWMRLPNVDLDVITTFTSNDGAWPAPPETTMVRPVE